MISTSKATSTIVQQLNANPAQAAHLNIGAGVATPNLATYNRATSAGRTNEYGGFAFPDIPDGSAINWITIRQLVKNSGDEVGDVWPATRFALKIAADERSIAVYSVDSGGVETIQEAIFAPGTITAAELKAGLLRIRKTTRTRGSSGGDEPPIPTL